MELNNDYEVKVERICMGREHFILNNNNNKLNSERKNV